MARCQRDPPPPPLGPPDRTRGDRLGWTSVTPFPRPAGTRRESGAGTAAPDWVAAEHRLAHGHHDTAQRRPMSTGQTRGCGVGLAGTTGPDFLFGDHLNSVWGGRGQPSLFSGTSPNLLLIGGHVLSRAMSHAVLPCPGQTCQADDAVRPRHANASQLTRAEVQCGQGGP